MRTNTLFEQAKKKLGYDANGLLRSTSSALSQPNFEDLSSISEWLALEKAKRLEADYVYFRRFDDRPSQPQVYIYDFTDKGVIPKDQDLGEIQKNIWSSSEVPAAFIFSKDAVRIINTTCQPKQNGDEFFPVYLIGLAHEITGKIQERFSSYRLDSGEFWHLEEKHFRHDKSAHKTLLAKLKAVQEKFLTAKILREELVNRFLIQCVLIRFLEEKKEYDRFGKLQQVFPPDFFQKIAQANSFKESLEKGTFIQVFDYLNKKDHLNGQIFEWEGEEKKELENVLTKDLVNLLYKTSMDEKSQLALWDLYSFRFLPVEVVSSIYEALFTTDTSVKEEGMVYTPPHLAAFLVDESMPLTAWKNKTNYKVLDPSCGSGVFLVLAFKRLVHWWRLNNKGDAPGAKELTGILSNSITGIDSNENAVLLTRFSLCLAVCDMLTPPEVYSELHFPELKDKLVHADFFDWFKDNKGKATFDLVIGNPPFVQAHKNLPNWKEISNIKIPQKQIALYFLSVGMQLVKEKGLLCLLLKSSSFIYTSTGNTFRKSFFNKHRVHQIIDFTLLARNHVLWENKEPDTLAVFASKEQPNPSKNILHLVIKRTPSNSLKRYFEIDTYDFHWIPYVAALQDDFVWKCNLLGGGRLYGLIKRLKLYPTLIEFIEKDNKDWTSSVGYRASTDPDEDMCVEISGKPTLPTNWLTENGVVRFDFENEEAECFSQICDTRIYKSPHIVIKLNVGNIHSIPMHYFSNFDIGFKDGIYGIAAPKKDEQLINKLFNSLKSNNHLYRAFIFSTSPKTLIYKNTVLLVEDIKKLPINKPINKKINLSKIDDAIIDDVVKHYQNFIRRPESRKAFFQIPSKNLKNHLTDYASIFCNALNVIYQNKNLKFRFADAGSIHNNNFMYVAFRYDDKPDITFTGKHNIISEISEKKLQIILTLDKGHARFSRILKIYKKDYVCFIKPNQLRYWLDSIALRDADWVISDLVKEGH